MAAPVMISLAPWGIKGVIYDFAEAGDILPMHDHTPWTEHITVMVDGAVEIRGPDRAWERTARHRDAIDLPPGAHEIEALEPGTRILNIVKGAAT